jgi:hypothetical protein
MVNLYALAAWTGAVIAACSGAMAGLSPLSTLGVAVVGAYVGMFVLAMLAYTSRS